MKKLMLVLVIVLLAGAAHAEALSLSTALEKIPWKQGVAYSFIDSKMNYISTIEVMKKWGFTAEIGYAGAADNTDHKLIGVISYPLVKMSDFVDVPVLNLIEANIGVYGGVGNICVKDAFTNDDSNEKDYGVSLTLLRVKW